MALSEPQKKYLRGLGHKLKPVVMIADAGLSESVAKEFELAIDHHELIKVSVRVGDRKVRTEIIDKLCEDGAAELVQKNRQHGVVVSRKSGKEKKNTTA